MDACALQSLTQFPGGHSALLQNVVGQHGDMALADVRIQLVQIFDSPSGAVPRQYEDIVVGWCLILTVSDERGHTVGLEHLCLAVAPQIVVGQVEIVVTVLLLRFGQTIIGQLVAIHLTRFATRYVFHFERVQRL